MNAPNAPELTPWQQDLLRMVDNSPTEAAAEVVGRLAPEDWRAIGEPVWASIIGSGEPLLFQRAVDCMEGHQMLSAQVLNWMMLNRPMRLEWLDTVAQRLATMDVNEAEQAWREKAIGGLMRQREWEAAGRLVERLRHQMTRNEVEGTLNTLGTCQQAPAAFVHQLLGPESPHKPQLWKAVKRSMERKEWDLAVALLNYSDATVREIYVPQLLMPDTLQAVAPLIAQCPDVETQVYATLQANAWSLKDPEQAQVAAARLDQLASLQTLDTQRRWTALNPGCLPLSEHRVMAADRDAQAQSQMPMGPSRPRQRS